MKEEQRYATPVALGSAITDRLRRAASDSRRLADLRRQFAYDRLLFRVFSSEDRERWVLKGATALLARLGGRARHSVDIDLFDQAGSLEEAEAALQAAALKDAQDHFRFVLAPGRRMAQGGVALRVPVTAYLGATEFERFNVDLVTGTGMTGTPEEADPLVSVEIPGIPSTRYRIYPIADHVADKVLALIEEHTRRDGQRIASTRYRDLADLVVIAHSEELVARALEKALRAQSERRRVELPGEFSAPDYAEWRAGYARVAKDVAELQEKEFDAAVATARRFLDPVLAGRAKGHWHPDRLEWAE